MSPTATVQVEPDAEPEAVLVPASIAADAPSVKAQVGAVVTSELDVNVRVTVSPLFTSRPPALSDRAGVLRVGWVLSMVTEPLPDVTAVPALPAASLKAIE